MVRIRNVTAALILLVAGCSKKKAPDPLPPVITPELAARSIVPDPSAQACAQCHPNEVAAWRSSQHANANRLVDDARDRAAFVPSTTLRHGSFETTMASPGPGLFTFTESFSNGAPRLHRAEAVIAQSPLRQYLVPFPGGRLQVMDVSYDPRSNEWFNAFGTENRQPGEWGHWTGRSMTWNAQCAFCHMTGFEKRYSPASDSYASTWTAMGISCAQCHTMRDSKLELRTSKEELTECPMVAPTSNHQPSTIDHSPYIDSCASCHARREQMTDTYKPGDSFHDHFRLTLADNAATFHPDGQVHDEDFEYNAFMMSRMGHKGISCLDCHDPHSYKLKLPVENNTLCLSCHLPPGQKGATVIDPVTHSHHSLTNKGSSCVECHMPHKTFMVRDQRRDHGFTSPDPVLTKELGIPNSCTPCHAGKGVDWEIEWVNTWYGDKMENRRSRQRARVIARAQAGDAANVSNLLAMARSEEILVWRATLVTLLERWAGASHVAAFLRSELTNAHPLVRAAAVNSLRSTDGAYEVLRPLRKDPSRLVRLDATWATLNPVERDPSGYAELLAYLDTISDQPAGAVRQSQRALTEDLPEAAEAWMRKAFAWDPSPVPQYMLGRVLHRNGKLAEAESMFLGAAAGDPANADYPYTLALLYAEMNRGEEALARLKKTVEIDPSFGRAWYNLGLAYAQQPDPTNALAALTRAEELLPESPEPPYAAATIHAQKGAIAAARDAALRSLAVDPSYRPALDLMRRLH